MEEENEVAEATSSEEEVETLNEGVDDPVVLKQQLEKEAQARRQITARAKKAEEERKKEREARIKLEEQLNSSKSMDINKQTTTSPTEDERLELRFQGYSKDEVNWIMQNGGSKTLEDPNSFTSLAIKARREQAEAEKAAAGTQSSGGEDRYKEADFRLSPNASVKDIKKSIEEMEKTLPHA